jgi:hypothetical protein
MYGKLTAAVGPAGTLAYTGVTVSWYLVAGLTLVFAGMATLKLFPKKKH